MLPNVVHEFYPFCRADGNTRAQLQAAAATAAELGLEVAPVELRYTGAFYVGSLSFRVVDPTAAEGPFNVKAEVRGILLSLTPAHPPTPAPPLSHYFAPGTSRAHSVFQRDPRTVKCRYAGV